MAVLDIHRRQLIRSTQIAQFQLAEQFISPLEVIRVLTREKISFVLVGAFGLVGWMRARASEDVDVIVAARQVKKTVRLLVEAFPQLIDEDHDVVVRLRDKVSQEVSIDVMKPIQPPYRAIFKHTIKVISGTESYRVPNLEMALVCKFASMVSLHRADERKMQDATDFMEIVKKNLDINLESLHELGDLVFNGGGKKVVEMVRKVRAGEKLVF
jgi:hypothetical protein